MKEIKSKKKKGLCVAYRCTSSHKEGDRFCSKHRHRFKKENNPIGYTYDALRQNARRRNIKFSISLIEFEKFCEETDYMKRKGKGRLSASIDRINPSLGYTFENIQVLSLSDNSKKMHTDCPF